MDEHERILEHLQKAEKIIIALNGDAKESNALHTCKVYIWKAIEAIRCAG